MHCTCVIFFIFRKQLFLFEGIVSQSGLAGLSSIRQVSENVKKAACRGGGLLGRAGHTATGPSEKEAEQNTRRRRRRDSLIPGCKAFLSRLLLSIRSPKKRPARDSQVTLLALQAAASMRV